MSIASISSSSQLANLQSRYQELNNAFKQLGQDLSAGDLTTAQADFVTLSQAAASQFGSNSPIGKALSTIGQALQSGNLPAAQQALSLMPGTFVGPCAVPHHAHGGHVHGFTQALNQLGQALQAGNLSAAQQAFASATQSWQAMSSGNATGVTTADPAGTLRVSG